MLKTSFLILLITAVATAQTEIANNETLETKKATEKSLTTAANDDYGECTKEYSCVDCYKARVCVKTASGFRTKLVFNCNDTSPTTPYCTDDSGTCTTTPPVSCGPVGNFTCVRDGTFPYPTDCTRYFTCLNSIPYAYKCDRTDQHYDSRRETCRPGAKCYTFNCRGKHGVKLAYGATANIFAYCVNGSAYVVDKCPANYELNADTQKCEPVCNAEVYIPDIANCKMYYKCVKGPSYSPMYVMMKEWCPQSYGFDPLTLRCVPIIDLKDCS